MTRPCPRRGPPPGRSPGPCPASRSPCWSTTSKKAALGRLALGLTWDLTPEGFRAEIMRTRLARELGSRYVFRGEAIPLVEVRVQAARHLGRCDHRGLARQPAVGTAHPRHRATTRSPCTHQYRGPGQPCPASADLGRVVVRCDTVAAWTVTSPPARHAALTHAPGQPRAHPPVSAPGTPSLLARPRVSSHTCGKWPAVSSYQGDASGRRVVARRCRRDPAGGLRPPAARLSLVGLIITGFTVIGLGLLALLLKLAGATCSGGVTQYDDGPYFGSALRLVHWAPPYRDFIIVQPPGITLVITPAALLAQVTSTAWGMAAGRILTVAASSAGIVLVGLLARHRGPLAVALSCGVLAISPGSLVAAHTVLLEPGPTRSASSAPWPCWTVTRSPAAAGGCCGAASRSASPARPKCWAIIPVVVIAVLLAREIRRAALFVAGVAIGVSASRSSRSRRPLRAGFTTASSRPRCSVSRRTGPRAEAACG